MLKYDFSKVQPPVLCLLKSYDRIFALENKFCECWHSMYQKYM